jgi:Caspase domain
MRRAGFFFAIVCVWLWSDLATAETRVALVIGNGAYQNTTPLANPSNDARDMAAALKGAGFDVVEAFDADKRGVDGALRRFTEKLANADVALFFYAGHGLQVGAQNYLVPTDAKLERERDLDFEAVKLEFILRQMEIDRDGKTSIVILDACRDNPLTRNLARSMGTRSAAIGQGLAAANTGLGTFIAYSTQPGNVALDGDGRNSPFTAAMVKHMSVSGRNLPATMIEVRKDVVAATGGRQVPWDHSALTGDFYFKPDGSTATSPLTTGSVNDVAALQARLQKLEDEAKQRNATAVTADTLKLSELRARATSLDELARDLQRKLLNARMQEGRATDPNEKAKLVRDSMNIQMEWSRRGQDLKKLRDEIAALDGSAKQVAPPEPVATAAIPVTPKATVSKESPNFEVAENVGLLGVEIRTFRAPSPIACREACEQDATCTGFQHGRKAANMGTCDLFSRVDDRREDSSWRSGLRTGGATPRQ